LSQEASDARADQDHGQPRDHAAVETTLEEIEYERARGDEEDEDPDWPVVETVVELVSGSNSALSVQFDEQRVGFRPGLCGHPGG
jgi:hypothetical protein